VKGHSDLIEDGRSGYLYELDNMKEFLITVREFYHGRISLDPEAIVARYRDFAKENVFDETLKIIKESFKD